jgi:lipopolysaccharide export system protein LptA
MLREKDEVRGDVIEVDTRSEFFTVLSGRSASTAANPDGRVRAVIQPKATVDEGVPAPAAPAAVSPPAKPAAKGSTKK